MNSDYHIERIKVWDDNLVEQLAELTQDVVKAGASVGFMQDLSRDEALCFWNKILNLVISESIILLVAKNSKSEKVVGTVQLVVSQPANQPHRADVAKMQVHTKARRRGIGGSLLNAIEKEALKAGKSLLVLDTATGSDAQRLYSRLGWNQVGVIPDYALWPDGRMCSTTFFFKVLSNG